MGRGGSDWVNQDFRNEISWGEGEEGTDSREWMDGWIPGGEGIRDKV